MAYLLQQIFWYVLIAFLLGLLTGWLIASQFARRRITALEQRIRELDARLAESPARTHAGTPVEQIEGIGTGFGKRLRADGIETTEQLLQRCGQPGGIAHISGIADTDEHTVGTWATMADLMRLSGIGGQWAELLWRAGVTGVSDLAGREAGALLQRMQEVNADEHRVHELPGDARVRTFIEEARRLAR